MNARLRELLEFGKCVVDCFPVSSDQTRVAADQRLHAQRFRRIEGGVPAGATLAFALRGVDQSRSSPWIESAERRAKVIRCNFASQSQLGGGFAEPAPDHTLQSSRLYFSS
jgi:hypothetical protein